MFSSQSYYRLSSYYNKISDGKKVHKVSVDAGLSCPNRDGKISRQGCVYCDNRGFSLNSRVPLRPLKNQIEEGMGVLRKKFGAEKFVIYFQAYSNTYAPVEILRRNFDTVRQFPDVIGLSVATRPDCVDQDILKLLNSYAQDYDVWIEYGLQSAHNQTLERINRGHSLEDFLQAVNLTRKYKNIKICVHVIIGLPGETKGMILKTAKVIAGIKPEGVKIHPLHIIKNTQLHKMFQRQQYKPLSMEEYAKLACDFLENLPADTVIQRISADCPQDLLVAPSWILDKNKVLNRIGQLLKEENKFQGRLHKG
jgi:radical SAM protein (TIGR01212 family)